MRFKRKLEWMIIGLGLVSFCLAPAIGAAATVVSVSGRVLADGTPLKGGETLKSSVAIQTHPGGSCEIKIGEQRIIRIRENTQAVLDFEDQAVDLKTGAIASVIRALGRLLSPDDYRYRVQTPTAVAGIRGTVFFVKVEDPDHTYVCACNGTVHMADPAGKQAQTVTADHHKGIRFSRAEKGVQISPAEMAYHTDAQMEKLATKVGVRVNWAIPERYPPP